MSKLRFIDIVQLSLYICCLMHTPYQIMSGCLGFTLHKPVCVLMRCVARLRDVNIYVKIATVESVCSVGHFRKNLLQCYQ